MRLHVMKTHKYKGDRRIGAFVDKREHETYPTIDVYFWWIGFMFYFSKGK